MGQIFRHLPSSSAGCFACFRTPGQPMRNVLEGSALRSQLSRYHMMPFDDLRDAEWDVIGALLCDDPIRNERRGRPRVDSRAVINGVLWLLSTGEGWSKLPGRYPSPPTCRRRFEQWQGDGTLAEVFKRLASCGREVTLRGCVVISPSKSATPASLDRLRGAFWTNPEVWRPPLKQLNR